MNYLLLTVLLTAAASWGAPSAQRPVSEPLLSDVSNCFVRSASLDGRFLGCLSSSGALGIIDRDRGEQILFAGNSGKLTVYGPVISPDGTRVVASFIASDDESHELRVIEVTGETKIIYGGASSSGEPLAWSRDGRFVAANLVGSDRIESLVVLSADGGSKRTLARYDGGFPRNVRFSHDGRYLVYSRYPDAPSVARDLFARSIDGASERQLTELPGEELFPNWLADGSGIFFLRSQNGSSDGWLLPMEGDAPSGPPRKLHSDLGDMAPFALTDEGDLYFTRITSNRKIHSAEVDFASSRVLAGPSPIAPGLTGEQMQPSFSPDGRHLVFVSLRGWGPRTSLVIRDLESGDDRVHSSMRHVHRPVWSRDSSLVLLRGIDSEGREGTFALDPVSGEVSETPPSVYQDAYARFSAAEVVVPFDNVRGVSVHPDGRRVAFVSGEPVFEHRVMRSAVPIASTYQVRRGSIDVDGALDEAAWDVATRETGFSFPWQEREASLTEFWALANDSHLYFAFRVDDADVVIDDGNDEEAVARGDRVELFFTPDLSLEDYVCFEIDPSGRVLDYRASFYREFDFEWDLAALDVAATLTGTGYIVEGSIPLTALPGWAEEGRVLTGIFRAEYSHRNGAEPLAEWISWVTPDSEEPDFHIPSAFGWLVTH